MSAQRQDSTLEQLRTVIDLANKAGCYDAADLDQGKVGSKFQQTASNAQFGETQ